MVGGDGEGGIGDPAAAQGAASECIVGGEGGREGGREGKMVLVFCGMPLFRKRDFWWLMG